MDIPTESEKKGVLSSWNPTKCHRRIIVDWLHQVSKYAKQDFPVTMLCISIMDIFLERKIDTPPEKFQLVACACLFIASKYEGTNAMAPSELTMVSCDCFSKSELLDMEKQIFTVIGYNVDIPTVFTFFDHWTNEPCGIGYLMMLSSMIQHDYVPSFAVSVCNKIHSDCFNYKNESMFNINIDSLKVGVDEFLLKMKAIINRSKLDTPKKSIKFPENQKIFDYISFVNEQSTDLRCDDKYKMSTYKRDNPQVIGVMSGVLRKLKPLGSGTAGDVYQVIDEHGNITAMKKFRELDGDGISYSFMREVACLQSLNHDNIVKIHALRRGFNGFYAELCDSDLLEYIKTQHHLVDCSAIMNFIGSMFGALEYIHRNGWIHRDIKPENILVKDQTRFLIADFGISRKVTSRECKQCHTDPVCTAAYRPPEIFRETHSTHTTKIDIWSMTIVLHQFITNNLLVPGSSVKELSENCLLVCSLENRRIFQKIGNKFGMNWFLVFMIQGLEISPTHRASATELLEIAGL